MPKRRDRSRPFSTNEEEIINKACGLAEASGRTSLLAGDQATGELTLVGIGPFRVERMYRVKNADEHRVEVAVARAGRKVFHGWFEQRRRRNGRTRIVDGVLTHVRGAWEEKFLALDPPTRQAP